MYLREDYRSSEKYSLWHHWWHPLAVEPLFPLHTIKHLCLSKWSKSYSEISSNRIWSISLFFCFKFLIKEFYIIFVQIRFRFCLYMHSSFGKMNEMFILNFGRFKPKYLLIPTILMKKKRFGLIRFHCTWKKLCLWMQTQTLRIYLHITICVPYRGNRSKGNLSTGWNQWTAVWNSQRKPEETFQTPLKVHIVCLVHNVLNVLGNAFYGK